MGLRHDLLAGAPMDASSAGEARKLLEDSWDVKTPDHLLQQLERLDHEGHRKDFAKSFEEIERLSESEFDKGVAGKDADERLRLTTFRKHAVRSKGLRAGLLGWDYARYVALCCWGRAAGFLGEEDAWKRMDKLVPVLQRSHSSWEKLGEVYCIGRECWRPGRNEETWKAHESLRTKESSPWRTTAWNLKLTPLDKPPKAPKKPAR